MDSVVEKASNLLDALEVSTTSKVKQFDERRLKRAFEWTNYFKKVYESVSQNPKTVEKLNARLKTLALSRNKELPEDYFTFNTFRDGEQILYKNFLSNPDFPAILLPLLSTKSVKTNFSAQETFLKTAIDVSQEKAVLCHLQNVQAQLVAGNRIILSYCKYF
ncbi:uncharacterized protein LOC144749714 isoform X1 [Ciona intestinalis]